MSSSIHCDKCKKIQPEKKENWVKLSLHIHTNGFEEAYGLKWGQGSWDLCPKCGDPVAKKLLSLVSKK